MTIFICADTHFGHKKIWEPRGFSTVLEHDETLVENWNRVVTQQDKVFLLGDVIFGVEPDYSILRRLRGKVFLALGNHDTRLKITEMSKIFHAVMGNIEHDHKIFTHIPIHESQMNRWSHNVHGHLHGDKLADERYVCVSMEHIAYTPVAYDELFS